MNSILHTYTKNKKRTKLKRTKLKRTNYYLQLKTTRQEEHQ